MLSKLFQKKKTTAVVSKGGSEILKYTDPSTEIVAHYGDIDEKDAIQRHIEQYVGEIKAELREIVSVYTQVTIYWIAPTEERNFHTLITQGLSHRPMNVPPGAEDYKYGELLLCLPPDWKLSEQDFRDENNYWPLRCLKTLACFPHAYNSWLTRGHSIPNGENAEPYASNTEFSGLYLTFPITLPAEFIKFQLSPEKTIWFYSVIPLYTAEMQFKLDQGSDALEELFDQHGISELLDPNRPPMC